ncbi:MAG: MFS transporter [Proteobacteria bacterium]|nr:MFS transporter [Pseudomonadota bacterium]
MRSPSAWAPLRHPPFRALWLATVMANLAVWMQNIGAAWMMTELVGSPLMVALVQTAMALPAFLLGLPSGVIADLMDKRRLLLVTQWLALFAMILLCVPALTGRLGPWSLLLYTFALGTTSALSMSAWLACTIDRAPEGQVAAAIALGTVSPNIARVVGPALAGALIAKAGAPILFVVVCGGFAVVLALLGRLHADPRSDGLPTERFLPAILSGLRYVRHSCALRRTLAKVTVFSTAGSALWALLPLIAREHLQLGADGYGVLLGCLGAGAVISALSLPGLYKRHPLQRLVLRGGLIFGLITLLSGVLSSLPVLCLLYVFGGMAWMAVNTTLTTVIQTSSAMWVKARVGSIYLMVIMGGMALGGVFWGLLAARLGLVGTLTLAGLLIATGSMLSFRHPLELGQEREFSPHPGGLPTLLPTAVDSNCGPVCVEISYIALPELREDFLELTQAIESVRRRNGASDWRLLRDLACPERYTERFVVASWMDYLRQHDRSTHADAIRESRLAAFHSAPGMLPRCYLIER